VLVIPFGSIFAHVGCLPAPSKHVSYR
jgi:hypothetical protein